MMVASKRMGQTPVETFLMQDAGWLRGQRAALSLWLVRLALRLDKRAVVDVCQSVERADG